MAEEKAAEVLEWRRKKRQTLARESQKRALRRMPLKEYHVGNLVRHFNLIVAEKGDLLPTDSLKPTKAADKGNAGAENDKQGQEENKEE